MEKVWESDNYLIYSDGAYYYAYQRQDVIDDGLELSAFFFYSSSLQECLIYTEE